MRRGVRWFAGREFLLCGRFDDKASADREAVGLRLSWELVKVRKTGRGILAVYTCWVHGAK
jgi:hypothetical protein